MACVQDVLSAGRVGDDRSQGVAHDVADTDCCGEVIYEICPANLGLHQVFVENVALDEGNGR